MAAGTFAPTLIISYPEAFAADFSAVSSGFVSVASSASAVSSAASFAPVASASAATATSDLGGPSTALKTKANGFT